MKAFNKIGFHTSVGGNPTGIGDWLRTLDAANIPCFIKAADSMTGLFDAQQLIYARNHAVPHTLVYRRSVSNDNTVPPSGNPDVPDYEKEPEAAAEEHWAWHRKHLPPELDPQLVWIETINELRKEVTWADWIGKFAYYTGQMTLAEGYKFSAFGYATGTPDEGAWGTDGMLQYLELCQQHPDQLSVALHEYSLKVNDIWFLRGDHIGRFQKLFAACDKHKLKRPKVLITEWGWTHERVPAVNVAVQHIQEVGDLYARYPDVLGAAIWYLGSGYSDIANLAQRLIKPVTDFTQQHIFDVPVDEPMTRASLAFHSTMLPSAVRGKANARFINDITIPDDTPIPVGDTFVKTWCIENSGETDWTTGYQLVFVNGTQMHEITQVAVPPTARGQQVQISVPMKAPTVPGVYFSDWRFQDDQGEIFGDIVYVRIVAEASPVDLGGVCDGKFVADITIPDDTEVQPGEAYTKVWQVQNNGTRAWGAGFMLEFVGGTNMAGSNSIPLPTVAPGAVTEISISMTAPTAPGLYFADYRLKDDAGSPFGQIIYVRIFVPSPVGTSLTPPLSQRDPLWVNMRLGHPGSPKTIGEWGCLLTCFAMVANGYGRSLTPAQLNNSMIRKGGFLDGYLTKWNALGDVYADIVYNGKVDLSPDITARINDSLDTGNPVTVLVDFTRDTPYTDNDQHWVLIVGRDGDDYRINDPWLLPAQEASLQDRYGRSGQPLWQIIRSAIFYRCTKPVTPLIPTPTPVQHQLLERGMNINPDAPNSNPIASDDLKGLDWVRFVFKLDARDLVSERGDIQKAFAQYDDIIRSYDRMGIKSLMVMNQETIWGIAPWTGNNNWAGYGDQLATAAAQIAQRYHRYGAKVAYEIWNEGDLPHNPASVYIPPEQFAVVLRKVATAIRAASPQSPLVFGGLATGPTQSIDYLQRCKSALNGPWPVDAIGIHPYGRWATKAPFDWGTQFGTLGEAFAQYQQAIADMPFWITELGVAADNEIGSQYYPEIGAYIRDAFRHIEARYADLIPVVIWFAWSDWMRNAGIVQRDGQRKPEVYAAFRAVRNREL